MLTWREDLTAALERLQHRMPTLAARLGLGLLLAAVSDYLGFREQDDEFRVMTVSTQGEPRFAEQFREVARGVIGKARDNLGVRFKLLVQDKSWGEALVVGEQIIENFPNSRMAGEVREMLDTLRERSGRQTPAG